MKVIDRLIGEGESKEEFEKWINSDSVFGFELISSINTTDEKGRNINRTVWKKYISEWGSPYG